jgi:hypothetical protein
VHVLGVFNANHYRRPPLVVCLRGRFLAYLAPWQLVRDLVAGGTTDNVVPLPPAA